MPDAIEKIRKSYYSMVTTKNNSTDDMINKLQQLKGKTKLKFYKNISNYYDNKNVRLNEDLFAKNAQCNGKIYHEVIWLKKCFQTKPPLKNMNIKYYDLYCTVIKNRVAKVKAVNQNENDYIKFNDIIPNHYIGRKNNNETLR